MATRAEAEGQKSNILTKYDAFIISTNHRNIEINITNNHHFAFVYLLR